MRTWHNRAASDSYNAWQRVRTRVAHKGLSLPDMKRLWEFAGLSRKPWDCESFDMRNALRATGATADATWQRVAKRNSFRTKSRT